MERVIFAFGAMTLFGGLMFWMGYRLGFNNGLATWRKSYRHMTPNDIALHKTIINSMADK